MSLINKIWYERSLYSVLAIPLLPFSLVFRSVANIRRMLYAYEFLASDAPAVPIIVVGGINVGGSGKTPLCIALAQHFQAQGYKVGILSRGYKATTTKPTLLVDDSVDAKTCGDEPYLMYHKTKALVVIDTNRVRGAFYLHSLGANLIICDDGMQHYALKRDIEIAVIDGIRRFGNHLPLPAGPLRESVTRLKSVDAVVINGEMAHSGQYSMLLKTKMPYAINSQNTILEKGTKVCAMAGIGNPQRFYKTLSDLGFIVVDTIDVEDHAIVDLKLLQQKAQKHAVVMTQKDAVKYEHDKDELINVYVLEVNASLGRDFYANITSRLKDCQYAVNKRQKKKD